jgi:hypothetical protein
VQFYIDDYPFLTAKIKYVYEFYIKTSELISEFNIEYFCVEFALISIAEYGIIISFVLLSNYYIFIHALTVPRSIGFLIIS